MLRLLTVATMLVCTALVGTGCGAQGGSATSGTETIDITFSGDSVEPNGERLEVGTGQPIDLVVKADKPGRIHVHSDPEQDFDYAAGTNTIKLSIDRPGVVALESHALGKIIVQLEVR